MKNEAIKRSLFTSKARINILSLLVNIPREFSEAEIVFECKMSRSSIAIELNKLAKNEIILKRITDIRTLYRANKKFIYFDELKNIFKEKS